MGKIYYVMGKSASGKDTIYKRLVKELPELGTVRMYTTRPIRDGETNGVEYIFTDEKQLQTMKDAGKVIECRTYDTIYGPWSYFTADDGQIDLGSGSYLMMGTLESYEKLCSYYGAEVMVPLYIHVEDRIRLQRALDRENTQKNPKYAEMCRRFLADEKDFAKERLDQCGIRKQYENTGLEPCIEEIIKDILCNEGKEKQMLKKIGFIGVGIMGKSMVRNLMKTGYELHIYARTKAKVDDVISEGAIFHESIKECVPGCDAVITIVGFPRDVEEVYFDEGGILENADPGTYLIDMTTTSPMLAEKISKEGTEKGFHVLDAPVTGGDTGAKNATLSILVGGEKEDYEACMELFKAMGTNINYQGKAGCGQHAKLANQIMIAGALSGVCEAFSYAQAKGLDLNVLFDSVSTGAAGSKQLDAFGPKIIAGDYAPGFFMKHFIKDMKLALTEANMSGLSLEVLSLVLSNYEELAQEGLGDLGTQALIKYYDVQDVEE